MTLDSHVSSSFDSLGPEDIGQARKIDELHSQFRKPSYRETWCCAWSPDNSYFAWSQGGGIVQLLPWSSRFNELITVPDDDFTVQHSPPVISDISWQFFKGTGSDRNAENEEDFVRFPQRHRLDCKDIVWSMAFSCCSRDDMKQFRRFKMHPLVVLATGLMKGKIKLWDVFTGQLLLELMDHKDVVRALDFSPQGLKLVSGSNDGTLKFWDLNNDGNMYRTLRIAPNTWVMDCKWSPKGTHLAAVGTIKSAAIWDLDNLAEERKLTGHNHNVSACDFTPDGALLATASFDTRVILWDVVTGNIIKQLYHLHPPPRPIYAGGANDHYVRKVAFSTDGMSLSTVADDGYLRVWDISDTTNPVAISHMKGPLCCAFSPKSSVIAVGNLCTVHSIGHIDLQKVT